MDNLVQIKLTPGRDKIKLKSNPHGQGDGALLNNGTVMKILDDSVNNNAVLVETLDGSNHGYIDIKHLHKVQSMNGDVPQMTVNYGDWVRNSTPSLAPPPQYAPPPGPPPPQSVPPPQSAPPPQYEQPTYVYRILINIGPDGIRLRSQPFDESNEDGATLYNGQYVTHNAPAFMHNRYVHVFAYPQAQGYIHKKYLGNVSLLPIGTNPPPPPISFPPYVPPPIHQDPASGKWYMVNPDGTTKWLSGGLRRRKFRSHKKHHVKSRSRSKKSYSRRR